MATKQYIVQPGDHLSHLAARFGFDADAAWNLPDNKPLRDCGRTPNLLCAGDVLYIPADAKPWLSVKTGQVNAFVGRVATVPVKLKMSQGGKPLAGEPCIVHLDPPKNVTTDGSGVLTVAVPSSTTAVTVEIPRLAIVRVFKVGHLDPLTELSGVRQRLHNLGWGTGNPADLESEGGLSRAIARFQAGNGLEVTAALDAATSSALAAAHGC